MLPFRCVRIDGRRLDARCLIALSARHRLFLSFAIVDGRGLTSSTSCATRDEPYARTHARTYGWTNGWTRDHRLPTIARDVSQPLPLLFFSLLESFASARYLVTLVTVARRDGRDEPPDTRSRSVCLYLLLSFSLCPRN